MLTKNQSDNYEGNKLRCYSGFKTKFEFENYLNIVKNPTHRKALAKFRISAHKLEIEVGRYQGVTADKRVCKQCSNGEIEEIEDELHFMFKCKKHSHIRDKLLYECVMESKKFNLLSMENKLSFMLNSSDNLLIHAAEFCHKAFENRIT